jgi:hypothetical protein
MRLVYELHWVRRDYTTSHDSDGDAVEIWLVA